MELYQVTKECQSEPEIRKTGSYLYLREACPGSSPGRWFFDFAWLPRRQAATAEAT